MKKVLDVIKNIAKRYIMAPSGLFGIGVLICAIELGEIIVKLIKKHRNK